jgi:leucyl aminopeptidase
METQMTEITLNSKTPSLVKVLIATKEEQLNYGITGNIIDRSTFNKLKALVERNDENCDDKKEITILDTIKDIVILLRPSNTATTNEIEELGGKLYSRIKDYKSATVYARHLPKTDFSKEDIVNALGLGIEMASYTFDKYQTQKKANEYPQLETVNFVAKEKLDTKIYNNTKALANAIRYARDLTNEPSNELTPEIYAKDIKRLENLGLKITLLDEAELKKKGFNMLLSVSQGSSNKPYVAILEYVGNKKKKGYDVALVGKGVTFDSGGISIKPSQGMWDMKQDMAGSAVVVSSLKALAQQKLNLNVVGIVGLVENMPSGTATRPGDIVTSLSGKTVEILNTDAEGRLVLGDCLTYVEKTYKPERIIDIATLTGAIIVSLGSEMAGLFSNDDCLSELLTISGEQSGENLWRFPLTKGYRKMIKSDIADVKYISSGREAGSITAACFLEEFVLNKTPWAHLDIAGMDMFSKPKNLYTKGASGFGVKLLNQFLQNIEKK